LQQRAAVAALPLIMSSLGMFLIAHVSQPNIKWKYLHVHLSICMQHFSLLFLFEIIFLFE